MRTKCPVCGLLQILGTAFPVQLRSCPVEHRVEQPDINTVLVDVPTSTISLGISARFGHQTTESRASVILRPVVAHEVSKRVLLAVADAFPEREAGTITKIEITQARDGAVQVDISHTTESYAPGPIEERQLLSLRSAVSEALGPWQHTIRTIEMVL